MKKAFFKLYLFLFVVFGLLSSSCIVNAANTSLTTKDASNIKINAATLNANIDSLLNSLGASYWFEYGTDNVNFILKTDTSSTTATGSIYKSITGLSPSTTYYFRVCAKDSVSVLCSNIKSFVTFRNPGVSSVSSKSITDTTASISGNVDSLGGNNVTVSYWFEYGIGSSYSSKMSTPTKTTTSIGAVAADLSSLKSNTTYYYRLCSSTNFTSANVCSSDGIFTTNLTVVSPTDSGAPVVKNLKYEFTSQNSVKLSARLDNIGKFSSLSYYFDYGSNLSYGDRISGTSNLSAANDFSLELKNLNYGFTYYFRACVRDIVNTNNVFCTEPSYFNIFDYKNTALKIGTSTVSELKDTSAKIQSSVDGFGGNDSVKTYIYVLGPNGRSIQTPQVQVPYTLRNFSILVENLISGTSYQYYVCYVTPAKVDCGNLAGTFTTLKKVVFGPTSAIQNGTDIILKAEIADMGISASNSSTVDTWFSYTSDVNFKSNVVSTTKRAYSGNSITEKVSGLKNDVKYYFKFCTNNGLGDVCSDAGDFIISSADIESTATPVGKPNIFPYNLFKDSSSSIVITTKVDSFGDDSSTVNYISWGESISGLKDTEKITSNNLGELIDFKLTGLSEKKKYYYKVCSKNSKNTFCSNVYSFSLFRNQGSAMLEKIPKTLKVTKLNVKFSETMRGKILQNQTNKYFWYVNPTTLRRYFLGSYENAFDVFKAIAISVPDADFAKLKNNKANSSYSGKVIFKASDPSLVYYVDTKTYRMWYFNDASSVEFVLSRNITSISDSDLLKIDYVDLTDMVYNVDKQDSDGDTLYDDVEINVYGTNPYYLDTDGDDYPDNIEISRGYSPLVNGE